MTATEPFRIGIVGTGFSARVIVPAFRRDSRCRIEAIAASTPEKATKTAESLGIPEHFGDWRELVESPELDAVAIALPPTLQPQAATAALRAGKAVFCEKPLATSMQEARKLVAVARSVKVFGTVDFIFPEVPAWQEAKRFLDEGELGVLRQAALVWHMETDGNRLGLEGWKNHTSEGGGLVNMFFSHSLHYLEWLFGPVTNATASLFRTPDDPRPSETGAVISLVTTGGLTVSVTASTIGFGGEGHRLTVYGNDGTMTLHNPTADYVKGFTLSVRRRTDGGPRKQPVSDAIDKFEGDGRIVAVGRLASRFLDGLTEDGPPPRPCLEDGLRVQVLLDAVHRSHEIGCRVDIPVPDNISA
jgi:predicted dehydrogenase|tara:strand:- start:346 stop:1422 length:1077 start_codon:yes stop_codon:yes gene_type:complete